jgi:hypothetical protein
LRKRGQGRVADTENGECAKDFCHLPATIRVLNTATKRTCLAVGVTRPDEMALELDSHARLNGPN